ncbi:MAG: serine--tRNA ligase [Methanothermobacter sp.]|nr:serine--tRNA ligase [Methanothermobacter sp.]
MKFKLKGRIIFNKDVSPAMEEIEEFIERANKDLLLKGSKEEKDASKIIQWEVKGKEIHLTIVSGRRVRAHDGLLRLKKPLTQLLGPKYHIGIRKMVADDYTFNTKISRDVPEEKLDEIKELPFVNTLKIEEDTLKIHFKPLDEKELRRHVIDRVVKQVKNIIEFEEDLTVKVTKAKPGEIVAKSRPYKPIFTGDPTEEAIRRGWVKKFPGRGQWFYTPPITALHRALEELVIQKIVKPLKFQECLFPKLIPLPIMQKMRYLEGLPEGMYYCNAPRRDPETFEKFKKELIIKKEIPIDLLKKGLKDPGYVIAPAQCEPFYQFLSHEIVDKEDLPIKFYDRSGWTYRWEAGGAKGLDRVHEFQRIELVWLGTPEQTEKIRNKTVELSQKLSDELELEWYTEIGDDPFYLEGRKIEERGIEFPDIPKYEMRITLPGEEKGVAVISANVHGTHFIEGFSIKEAHGEKIWTGCTGIGLTRWVFGFLAQKGFETDNWPKAIKNKIKEVEIPPIITWP